VGRRLKDADPQPQAGGAFRAYVQAVAAQAGVICSKPELDYGIDLCLRAVEVRDGRHLDVSVQLDLQLRSTTLANVSDAQVAYDLDVDTSNDLRTSRVRCPRILVLLVLPGEESEWLSQTPEALALRRAAYWLSLRSFPARTATRTVRVPIPIANLFSVAAVQALLRRVRDRKDP
jgi:Domain of unknown function (DUF4365)